MRTKIITEFLDIPFISLVLKYDYYLEGIINSKLQDIKDINRIIKISEDQLLVCTYKSLYHLKDLKVISFLHNVVHIELLSKNRIVTTRIDSLLQVWFLNDLTTPLHEFQPSIAYSLRIFVLPNDKVVLYGLHSNIPIWDLKNTITELEGHMRAVSCMTIYKNKLITGSEDTTLKVWNLNTNMCENTLIGHEQTVNNVLVSQENLIISSSISGIIRIWDSEVCQKIIDCGMRIQKIITYEDKIITCYKYNSPKHNEIHIWNIYTDIKYVLVGHPNYINNIHLLPNGNLISSSIDTSIRIWDLEQNKCIKTWNNNHRSDLVFVCNNTIITDYEDGLIVWK